MRIYIWVVVTLSLMGIGGFRLLDLYNRHIDKKNNPNGGGHAPEDLTPKNKKP